MMGSVCSRLNDVHEMIENNGPNEMTSHKEKSKARMDAAVNKDREKIQSRLSICIGSLNATHQSSGIVNIVTGEIGPVSVNVDQAVSIGCQ